MPCAGGPTMSGPAAFPRRTKGTGCRRTSWRWFASGWLKGPVVAIRDDGRRAHRRRPGVPFVHLFAVQSLIRRSAVHRLPRSRGAALLRGLAGGDRDHVVGFGGNAGRGVGHDRLGLLVAEPLAL